MSVDPNAFPDTQAMADSSTSALADEPDEPDISPQTIPAPDTPPAPAATPIAAASAPVPALKLAFHGSAAEYFRLWIVNLCLTLATLGIYSAWAKVRKKRYIYSHTTLDGTPFQYLAKPLPILKGRLIAVAFFALYWSGINFYPGMLPWVLGIAALLAPWVMVRAAAFNARYSAFRNFTFEFHGTYWGAFKVIYGWGLLMIVTLGLGFAWWQQRIKRYMVRNFSFGGESSEFDARGLHFFGNYFLAGVAMVVGVALIAGASFGAIASQMPHPEYVILPVAYLAYLFPFAIIRARIGNLVWNHTTLGPVRFRSTLRVRSLARIYITNVLAIVATLGLATPWAVMRTLRYRVENMQVLVHGNLAQFVGGERTAVSAAGAEIGELFDLDLSL